MKISRLIYIVVYLLVSHGPPHTIGEGENKVNTELVNEPDDRPLLLSTLGGGMVAVNQLTGEIIWTIKDEPAVKVPNTNNNFEPQFLPDPRHGSLYMFGMHAGQRHVLKKLPFTIPQLVANAPCRSSDGILYTGKKIDTWFMIDPKTGIRKHVLGYGKTNPFDKDNTCPMDTKNAVFVARTEYNILMYDSKNSNQRWNVTYFDYSSHTMEQEMTNKYGIVHFASTSNGRVASFDRQSGEMVWSHDLQSPIVAAYILDREGLISVPFNTVGDNTMEHIMDDVVTPGNGKGFKDSNMELFPSLYVGEHVHGLYALTSLVDKNTFTLPAEESTPLLLEGPTANGNQQESDETKYPYRQNFNVHFSVDQDGTTKLARRGFLILGHYNIPDFAETDLRILSKYNEISIHFQEVKQETSGNKIKLIAGPSDDFKEIMWLDRRNDTFVKVNLNKNIDGTDIMQSVGVQTDFADPILNDTMTAELSMRYILSWISQQDNIGLKLALLSLVVVVFFMFIYLRNQIREFQQLSQSGSRNSSQSSGSNLQITALSEEMGNGLIRVGKIIFNPDQVLGKGCEGTFVYRGQFENRDVAVKRLLPECFTFADREVALLSESDAHPNVVRYFCTEQDKLFRYIALELCQATLQEYVQKNLEHEFKISPLEVLQQATSGLTHLHALKIVHRDVKPHNVLLSIPSNTGEVRAMISDFGLCKKLNLGRNSFSRRSGVTGTDGWIAPEMINGERTTTSVDIFSLGCVFHYVLTNGIHPFGNVLERQAKISKGHFDLGHVDSTRLEEEVHLSKCLLKTMLSSKPSERPTAESLISYPLFWSRKKVLAFFQDVSDRVEKDPPGGPLEVGGLAVVRGDWRGWVGEDVAADLRKYRSYGGSSVKDLLRAMRNKKHHYRELADEAQKSLGSIPDGFTVYWLSRFPRLLLHTWLQMQIFKHEQVFKPYYNKSFSFNANYIIQEIEAQELSKYESEAFQQETNQLFVKSRNYYESPKHMKFKNYENKNQANNIEDWRAGPRPDDADFVNNRQSPLKSNNNKNNKENISKFNKDDGKRDRRRQSKDLVRNNPIDQDVQLNATSDDADLLNRVTNKQQVNNSNVNNRVRHRRNNKKTEEPVVWVLPNQSNNNDPV